MIGVSKTFGGSSILSSPALKKCAKALILLGFRALCFAKVKTKVTTKVTTQEKYCEVE